MGSAFGRLSAKLKRFAAASGGKLFQFAAASGGNVAMTFGLATLPIIGSVGAAIDFGHAHSVKSAMQSALDSTALMISRDAPNLNDTELQTKVRSLFHRVVQPAGGHRVDRLRTLHIGRRIEGDRQRHRQMLRRP